jgi:NAD-dependent SIR2 family protein deacetylase
MICPPELRRLYRDGRVLPFIGAGVSMSVTWNAGGQERRGLSWSELVDEAIRQLGSDEPNILRFRGTDLQILEYFRLKKNGFAPLTNWLYSKMEPPDDDLKRSQIHAALSNLEKCSLFYTTNFDDFLERSLRLHGRAVHVTTSEADMGYDEQTQVIKFHGDLNSPHEMVLSESHYEQRMRLESAMDLKLRSDILGRTILFIGYSFRDPNIAYLFRTVNEKFSGLPHSFTGKRAYIIAASPSDFELQLFQERKIEVIPTHDLDRTRAVSELLGELVS